MTKTKTKLVAFAVAACFAVSSAHGSFSLLIGNGGFADSEGTPLPAGTLWGIVVDTQDNDFAGIGALSPFALERETMLNGPGGDATGIGLVHATSLSEAAGPPPTFTEGWFNAATGIWHADNEGGMAGSGMSWGIIWFPGLGQGAEMAEAGQSYGFFNPNRTVPSDGANITDINIGNDIKTADYTVVPEPSTYAAIFGFGVLLFVFLRRRFKK